MGATGRGPSFRHELRAGPEGRQRAGADAEEALARGAARRRRSGAEGGHVNLGP